MSASKMALISAPRRQRTRGFSLVEVVVAMAILVIGVVALLQFFPPSLRASSESALKGQAALLAQLKVEELRRDEDQAGTMISSIENLADPTDLVVFPEDERLAYQFHSRSLVFDGDSPTEVEDDFGVARVIVRYNPAFRPSSDVLFELRFDQ